MQILSIRGENIASLAKPFEIRLDAAPLATAGLFAITGETGAGKSSLLDAMCLALYCNCPRLSGDGTSEKVEEIGQELSSTDPRMFLRRGAASGFAEVTFRSHDGETYTAGWQARRARDRIDGRLQAIGRSLVRGSDGQMLETQVSRVNEKVVELTGLTYDEFRRTVLLAQGDFAAFLDARTQERAAILEKVTGTGIYRDISCRVFERTRQARATLVILETRRGEHQLLTPEDRDEIAGKIASLRAEQTAATKALDAVRKDLAQYAAVETAEANLTRAKARAEAAQAGIEALADDRCWLTDLERAQILRGEVREQGEATRALEDARREHGLIAEDHAAQQGRLATARTQFEAAKSARDGAENAFKAFAPIWDQAAALDQRIANAAEEHAKAATAVADLTRVEADRQTAVDALVAQETALEEKNAASEQALTAVEGHAALLANWGVIEERLCARIKQAGLAMTSASEAQKISAFIAAERAKRQTLETEAATARGEVEAARKSQEAIRNVRARLTEAEPGARLERLTQAEADLRNMRNAAGAVRLADQALAEAQARRGAAKRTQLEQKQALEEARAAQTTALELVRTLRQPAEAAATAASREAENLRQHLANGAPCPVCGSTTHPIMANGEIARLAEDLRHRLAAAQAQRDTAEAAATQATLRIEAAESAIKTETVNEPGLTARIEAAEAGYARARAPLETGPLAGKLPDTPRAEEAHFDTLQSRITGWRKALEADRDWLAELDRQHRGADATIETAKASITEREGEIRDIEVRVGDLEKKIARLEHANETAQTAVEAIDQTLAPLLAPTGIRADTFGPDATLEYLREQVATLVAARDLVEITRKALGEHAFTLAEARAELFGAATARKGAEASETGRRDVLAKLRTDRAALLGGEETGAHRTRHNDARTSAQTAFDISQQTLTGATQSEAALRSALEAAIRTETSATARLTAARTTLAAACEAAGIEEMALLVLHAAEPNMVEARRSALKKADAELAAAAGARQERDQECETLRAAGLPDTPKNDLETVMAGLEIEALTRSESLGAFSQQLDTDARAAKALAGLEADIEAARKTTETWAAVNDAVGSAKGDRFAQIAQAVTLALLVERANLHLDDLKPRYQLKVAASDLALHVIDRDMADDARPTRLLSGGERFLASLALALALSGMGNRGVLAGTLFIDEGFGSLDSDSLDLAIDALERLQAQGRTVGVISHVQAMKDRIPVQLQVHKTGGGASEVDLLVR